MKTGATIPESKYDDGEIERYLAQANRMVDLEQVTALMSHEMKQRIAATIIYAQAATRWLSANPPNLDEARSALDGIVRTSTSFNEFVDRARQSFASRSPLSDR
ncbi:hypothetical protein GCM10027093_05850 [Paraburkholderia jirisanensis]